MSYHLLELDEPTPVLELRRKSDSPFVIAVDHASRRIPRKLGSLGLPPTELSRHIAWDIGALEVAKRLSAALGATLVAQNYSRLVIDCNRSLDAPSSIPEIGELTPIPGNMHLSGLEITARRAEIFQPYHDHLSDLLDERMRAGQSTILVVQHSMTDVFLGVQREMHTAVLYDKDRRLAGALLDALRIEPHLIVGDNEPYSGQSGTGFTLPNHAVPRGLPHAEIEIRQDLILDEVGQAEWAQRLTDAFKNVRETLGIV